MDVASSIGIDPLRFWEMTPSELSSMVRGYNRKTELEQENQLVVAYLGAYWNRVKSMPKLSDVVGKKSQKPKQDANAMLDEIKRINLSLGGTVY